MAGGVDPPRRLGHGRAEWFCNLYFLNRNNVLEANDPRHAKLGNAIVMAMETTLSRPRPRALFGAYLLMWAVVGISALAYIVLLLARPDLVTLEPVPAMIGEPDTNEGQRAMAKALADLQVLRNGLTQAQLDISKLKAEVDNHDDQGKRIAERLTAIEIRIAAATDPDAVVLAEAAPKDIPEATDASSATVIAKSEPAASTTAAADALKPVGPTGGGAPARIETGSVNKAETRATPTKSAAAEAIAFGPAVVKPAKTEIGVRLANGPSVDALRLSWSLLAERHADTLGALAPRYTESRSGSPTPFELLAGPVKNSAEARRICSTMHKRGIACEIGPYTGNAL